MDKILTLEQLQKMSIEDIKIAYQNGYILSESPELYSTSVSAVRPHEPQQHTVSLQTPCIWTPDQIISGISAIASVIAAFHSSTKAKEASLSLQAARDIKADVEEKLGEVRTIRAEIDKKT